ncbi:hypothetical protein BD779DRAFT_1675470 [Infundibulicybe gibba]|nr:hypothetical protein BD779DRAFT_1675470 [Infundibulicybe gibba]
MRAHKRAVETSEASANDSGDDREEKVLERQKEELQARLDLIKAKHQKKKRVLDLEATPSDGSREFFASRNGNLPMLKRVYAERPGSSQPMNQRCLDGRDLDGEGVMDVIVKDVNGETKGGRRGMNLLGFDWSHRTRIRIKIQLRIT